MLHISTYFCLMLHTFTCIPTYHHVSIDFCLMLYIYINIYTYINISLPDATYMYINVSSCINIHVLNLYSDATSITYLCCLMLHIHVYQHVTVWCYTVYEHILAWCYIYIDYYNGIFYTLCITSFISSRLLYISLRAWGLLKATEGLCKVWHKKGHVINLYNILIKIAKKQFITS